MLVSLHPMTREDKQAVLAIFNHYVVDGHAVLQETPAPGYFFDRVTATSIGAIVARSSEPNVVGFGLLRPYNSVSSFRKTCEFSCFLLPEYTGQGIGSRILSMLEDQARRKEMRCIMAAMSDRNPDSLRFHIHRGFLQCGHFPNVYEKKGIESGVIWVRKSL